MVQLLCALARAQSPQCQGLSSTTASPSGRSGGVGSCLRCGPDTSGSRHGSSQGIGRWDYRSHHRPDRTHHLSVRFRGNAPLLVGKDPQVSTASFSAGPTRTLSRVSIAARRRARRVLIMVGRCVETSPCCGDLIRPPPTKRFTRPRCSTRERSLLSRQARY